MTILSPTGRGICTVTGGSHSLLSGDSNDELFPRRDVCDSIKPAMLGGYHLVSGAPVMRTKTTWVQGIAHQRGCANNAAKLTEIDVEDIRRRPLYVSNMSLAAAYGVDPGTIARARARKTWRHVA